MIGLIKSRGSMFTALVSLSLLVLAVAAPKVEAGARAVAATEAAAAAAWTPLGAIPTDFSPSTHHRPGWNIPTALPLAYEFRSSRLPHVFSWYSLDRVEFNTFAVAVPTQAAAAAASEEERIMAHGDILLPAAPPVPLPARHFTAAAVYENVPRPAPTTLATLVRDKSGLDTYPRNQAPDRSEAES
ncbi:hypothetical protein B0T26DRAFT_753970 [Lasiosphaeria miniovina]|uniref:Uncharacterized protein n=1 Tax=Lasiosphaeria miniovina TaxID=1954250 RepID=A0AA40ADR7_9PEZI|nr:uncharacterized protein B0T26DRAFT_753970 [Lasiosphaeria miniovina]KAK0713912.1 hypothetical protein B0T26DRAFT_753970 [Lasiosphaeria miniovina]